MTTRKTIFAGSWYPGSASGCDREIGRFLEADGVNPPENVRLKGGVVPHAGWHFSGEIACRVIQLLSRQELDIIFIFGTHLRPGSQCFITDKDKWETPLGDLDVDREIALKMADKFPFQTDTGVAFDQDNTIELQLPFIKYFFNGVKILPMGVPPDPVSIDIGEYAACLANELGLSALALGSTDLTHYGPNYGFSPKGTGPSAHEWVSRENDGKIIDLMLKMDPMAVIKEARNHQNACCAGAAAAAIAAGKGLGAEDAWLVKYSTSYEKSPGDSFVGYGGVIF